ncbi:hypothetical protein H0H92_015834, partial [Tricholoma furcatifolium]
MDPSANLDLAIVHHIKFEAGASNSIILSKEHTSLANQMIESAEMRIKALEEQIRLERLGIEPIKVAIAPHKCLPPDILS